MTNKEIDYGQIKKWVETYNKYKQPKRKQQLLTLIVLTCAPLVRNIAYGLARRSSDPVEDIIQVGNVGLIKGIQKYKPEYKNIKSYLKTCIIGEIKHYLRDKVQSVKAPRVIIELSYRINKLNSEEIENFGETFNIDLVAQKLNTTKDRIKEFSNFDRRKIISLDQLQFPNDEDLKTYEETVYNENDTIENNIDKIILNDAINQLPQNLKKIIKAIYFDNVYQTELAKMINTSQSNISRLQKRALKMLFDIITSKKKED